VPICPVIPSKIFPEKEKEFDIIAMDARADGLTLALAAADLSFASAFAAASAASSEMAASAPPLEIAASVGFRTSIPTADDSPPSPLLCGGHGRRLVHGVSVATRGAVKSKLQGESDTGGAATYCSPEHRRR
jgi:hypothetical protein